MPAGTTPPDPWKLYADFFDLIDDAADMEAVGRLLELERNDAEKARSIADEIEERYPQE